MAGYKGKYIRTYIWSGLSMLLNFLSMFIVAPLTTSMPEAYGVYSLCISFNIFIQYADLGFINAGRKYAAEAFANEDSTKEKKYVGTALYIYSIMSVVLFLIALVFSVFPGYLIRGIGNSEYYGLAQQLLLILSFTFLFSIIKQFVSLIYSIRIEEYKIQSIQIVGSIIKIASVPLYFFNEKYDILGYYLFCELINLFTSIYLLYHSKEIGYGLKEFLKIFKFDKEIFAEIKALALSGFVSVIGWVAYFELDTVGISVLLGANAVAIYAVGKQMQNFIRSLVGICFSPYRVRINYYIGQKDLSGLKSFYYRLTEEFCFIIIPIIVLVLYAKPFILSWVGEDYLDSSFIMQLLVLTFIINHITSQGSSVIYGLNKINDILKIAIIQPLFFWIGVSLTYKVLGVESFAIFKLAACLLIEFYYCYLTRKYLYYNKTEFYWHLLAKPLLIIIITTVLFWLFTDPLLSAVTKGHKDLLYVVFIMAGCCVFSLSILFCFNKPLRQETVGVLKSASKFVSNIK